MRLGDGKAVEPRLRPDAVGDHDVIAVVGVDVPADVPRRAAVLVVVTDVTGEDRRMRGPVALRQARFAACEAAVERHAVWQRERRCGAGGRVRAGGDPELIAGLGAGQRGRQVREGILPGRAVTGAGRREVDVAYGCGRALCCGDADQNCRYDGAMRAHEASLVVPAPNRGEPRRRSFQTPPAASTDRPDQFRRRRRDRPAPAWRRW